MEASARKTGRVVIVEEGPKTGGRRRGDRGRHYASVSPAPAIRRAWLRPNVPVPFSPALENAYRPDVARIVAAARRLADSGE